MAQYSNLKAYIEEKIYENGTQAITGDILQDVLKVMTDDLGDFYQTGGVASPSTDPGTPDAKVIYIATEAGTYTNFGGITLAAGEVALLIFETSWTKETLNVLSAANGGVKTANLADGAVTTEKIAGGAVETAKIADNAVTSGKVADGAIGTAKIADGAIGADKIAANAVESAKIKNGAVTEGKINDGAVTAGKIASNAVTTGKIKDDAVTSDKIANNAVGNDQLASGAVHAGNIADGAVTAPKIGGGAVTSGKIGSGAVTEEKIADGAVTSDKIANGAVGSDQLAEGAFSAQNLADGSVTTDKLADEAVTAEKIADGAVTAGKFADGSVSTAKLASGAVITEKIGDGMVTRQKLADSSVGTSKIIDGAVTTAKVADANVTTAKIADANVTTGKLADGAVTTAKIADGNVTGAKLQEGVRPVINVNALNEQTSAYGSAALARAAVPSSLRILGLHIIYLLAGGWFEDEYIGSDVSGWGTASNWRAVEPVSVSQNTETGKTELLIGNTPILIIDNKPELNSDNLVKSGGVYNNMPHIITNSEDADFGVSDSDGNVILESEEGHIKTKNFDSRNSPISTYDNSDSNFNIGDSNGNVICELKDGHIKTKNFDSRDSGGVVEYFNQDIKFVEPRSGAPSRLITSSTLTNKTTDEWLMIYCPGNGHTRDSVSFPDEALAYFRANKINVATLSYQTTLYGEPCVAWGSDAAYNAIIDLYNFLMANFGLKKDVILAGGSMGGLAMGQLAYKQPFPIRCCIGLGIVPGLDICWENSTTASPTNIKPKIRQTFGLAADGSEDYLYYEKSVGYDYRKYGWITVNETDYKTGYPNFYLYYGNDSVISGLFGGVENYNSMAQALINAGVYSEVKSAGNFIHDDPRIWLAYLEDNVLYKEIRTSIYNNN